MLSQILAFLPTQLLYLLCFIATLSFFSRPFLKSRRDRIVEKLTALNDLPGLGKPRKEGKRIDGTAIIAGGSVAGLLAARVCSTHFARVLIVEPEAWTSTEEGLSDEARLAKAEHGKKPNTRSRVQQYTSVHSYQVFTYRALKEMFPDLETEALKIDPASIVPCDLQLHMSGRHMEAPYDFYDGKLPNFLSLSRPAYETLLRKLVRKNCDNVEFVIGTVTGMDIDVDGPSQGLEGAGTGHRVQSVTIRSKDGVETTEPALLLIDCTGPVSASLKWLSASSKPVKVPRDIYDPKMYYTSCEYYVDPAIMANIQIPRGYSKIPVVYVFVPDPAVSDQSMMIFKREKNTLQIVCGGWAMAARPRSVADVRTFISQIKSLEPIPHYVFKLLDSLETNDCDASATYTDVKVPPSTFVKYHEVAEKLPSNLIALGDSVIRVNPIRGQGCTKAMIGAVTLSGILQSCNPVFHSNTSREVLPDEFGKIFWERHTPRTKSIWNQTKTADYGWKTTVPVEGETLEKGAFIRWYTRNFFKVSCRNKDVAAVGYNSAMFLAPPTDVISPGIAVQVIWQGFKELFASRV
ncbi:hypothetical protein SISNIDRAFT_483856 [Sistotremastrum niveocremeum HHB9708]|uniref:FAD/NAD(P)-binding domain-containing protein n=1 Tax=Sistotremastrum niveocremeum HHB9708 TaxID=1314777 RepID=A0A164X4N0_9AGAM|nr:hypothetical protein SISNIDRAFT_483856 [Sistotremastrum niveocremeum HHB9708]